MNRPLNPKQIARLLRQLVISDAEIIPGPPCSRKREYRWTWSPTCLLRVRRPKRSSYETTVSVMLLRNG